MALLSAAGTGAPRLLFRLAGGTDLLAHWIRASPWLNLLPSVAFFFMARRLFGSAGVAVTALACSFS